MIKTITFPKRTVLYLLLLFLTIPTQAALYIVGSATEYMWARQPMTETTAGVYQWSGYLSYGGELKFMTAADGWGVHWGPASAFSSLPYGHSAISLHASGDYKYRIDNEGYANITVDTKQKSITLTRQDGTVPYVYAYPHCLYPIGSAITGQSGYALRQEGFDTGIYAGQLQLSQGDLTFHSRPYYVATEPHGVQAKLSSDATVTRKKLYTSLSIDRCAYQPGQAVSFTATGYLPAGTHVRYRHLGDVVADTLLTSNKWTWMPPTDDFRGYLAEVYTTDGTIDNILGTIAIDVSSDWNRFPRYGFVATFGSDKTLTTTRNEMTWLNRCHINAVQFQDWHDNHDAPLAGTPEKPSTSYKDIANRTIFLSAIRNYINQQHQFGMKSFFYNLCFGALKGYTDRGVKAEWMAYIDKNHATPDKHSLPSSWKSDIYLTNPGNTEWQAYLAQRNDDVYRALDFDGYQIDQLGPRATLYDYKGQTIDLPSGYASFIEAMKNRHPEKRLIMNAVSGYGTSQMAATGKLDCFYNEVWGCHAYDALTHSEAQFAHLKTIIDNNRTANSALQTILAAYMNYECDNSYFNIPGIVMADAVMFALGGTHLELGGDHNLCREYFPYNGQKMGDDLKDWLTHYYDFHTAYENLLRGDWTENTNVRVSSTTATINKWAPVNGQITQLARNVEGRRIIHLLNFNCQSSTKVTDPAYLLCWHDKNGLRPWPVEYKEMPLTITGLTGMGKVRRIWVASPDYMGGAVQEITDYQLTAASLKFTLPALQYWTMIVIEPETTTTTDNLIYGPDAAATDIPLGIPTPLQRITSTDAPYDIPFPTGTYDARADLKAGTLTLSRQGEDGILTLPLANDAFTTPWDYTLSGHRATPHTRGIIVKQGRKTVQNK